MENAEIFKITFWATSIMIFVFSVGVLLLLVQIYHKMVLKIKKEFSENSDEKNAIFSEREKEVLLLLMKGYNAAEVAGKLNRSQRTIERHKENMKIKTETKSIIAVVYYAYKHKIFSVEELRKSEK